MSRFNLPTLLRSAAIALALGGATLGAVTVPAQAASATIDLHFGFGGGGISIGGGKYCLSDRQVRFLLRNYGYSNIHFFDRKGRVVGVRAERHHRDYLVWVDTCRARIVSVQRLHRHNSGYGGLGGYDDNTGYSGKMGYSSHNGYSGNMGY
jgi:hypothetical protein